MPAQTVARSVTQAWQSVFGLSTDPAPSGDSEAIISIPSTPSTCRMSAPTVNRSDNTLLLR